MFPQGWSISNVRTLVLIFAALLFSLQLTFADFAQQGPQLVGTGAVVPTNQGYSVAVSSDGNTAIVGGPLDKTALGRRGSSLAAAVFGPSRATSWSAVARLEKRAKANPSPCPPTAIPPSWAGLTTRTPGRRGSTPATAVSGPSKAANWLAPARMETHFKAGPLRCPPMAAPPLLAGLMMPS